MSSLQKDSTRCATIGKAGKALRMPKKHTNVFVSYSHDDASLVAPVVKLLRANNSLVFQDVDSIQPGKKWRREIAKGLADAHQVMVFWCNHANGSEEVTKEWKIAIELEKDLLPLLLDTTPLPPELSEYQWIDFQELVGRTHARMTPYVGETGTYEELLEVKRAHRERFSAIEDHIRVRGGQAWDLPWLSGKPIWVGLATVMVALLVFTSVDLQSPQSPAIRAGEERSVPHPGPGGGKELPSSTNIPTLETRTPKFSDAVPSEMTILLCLTLLFIVTVGGVIWLSRRDAKSEAPQVYRDTRSVEFIDEEPDWDESSDKLEELRKSTRIGKCIEDFVPNEMVSQLAHKIEVEILRRMELKQDGAL